MSPRGRFAKDTIQGKERVRGDWRKQRNKELSNILFHAEYNYNDQMKEDEGIGDVLSKQREKINAHTIY
jgi:hypothetical protein